jgi:ABC-2 type transport system permease protein
VNLPVLSRPPEEELLPVESMGQLIHGPRALDESWSRFWSLAYNIARSEFKLKFFGSVLGYVWQVMRPLLLFGVLYVFFVRIFHVDKATGAAARFYGAQLLGSIVLFTFFSEAATGAVRSVVDRENLVRKIQFPRLAIPISVVLLALFNLALNLTVVMIFAVISGARPMLSWLELPLIILVITVFATGVAMLLSALFVKFRDIQPIWEVLSQILFYSSPVIIPAEKVKEALVTHPDFTHKNVGLDHFLYHLYTLNPLVALFQTFRHAMINPGTKTAGSVLGSWADLWQPLGLVVVLFVLGYWVFSRAAPHIAEDL